MNEPASDRINPIELERLVDGRLSPDQYRQLLQQIERTPGAWRSCALAFLENQALQVECTRLAGRLSAGSEPPRAKTPLAQLVDEATAAKTPAASVKVAPAMSRSPWYQTPWGRFGSIIAVGLSAFIVGLVARNMGQPTDQARTELTPNNTNNLVLRSDQDDTQVSLARHPVASFDLDTEGETQSVRVPIHHVGGQESQSAFQSVQLAPRIDDVLQGSRRFRVQQRMIPVVTSDQRVLLFAVDEIYSYGYQ